LLMTNAALCCSRNSVQQCESRRQIFRSDLQLTGAVSEFILLNSKLIKNGQHEVRHRCVCVILQVTPAFDLPGGASDEQNRERIMIVLVSIAQCAAVKNQGMIQKIAVAVRRLFELVEKVSEGADVVSIQHSELVHVLSVVGMMRSVVETFTNSALRVNGSA